LTAVSLGRRALLSLAFALLFGAPALARCAQPPQSLRTEPLSIVTAHGPARFTVEIADTPQSREIGLMCRTRLAADRGMLFDFKQAEPVQFWMKNTLIPLDMLFIGPDGKILTIAANAKPMDETPIPSQAVAALGVLEIAGGRAAALGIAPGDKVIERIFSQ
jgi:uncharacterized membrane protein (UPF0127 family)